MNFLLEFSVHRNLLTPIDNGAVQRQFKITGALVMADVLIQSRET